MKLGVKFFLLVFIGLIIVASFLVYLFFFKVPDGGVEVDSLKEEDLSQPNSQAGVYKELIKCDSSVKRSDSTLNIFFVGAGYSGEQIFCDGECNISSFEKVLENDVYRLLYSENQTQGFGLFTIEPFRGNLDKVNVYIVSSPVDCDYISNFYCFFDFRNEVEQSCPIYAKDDHIYLLVGYDNPASFSLGGGTPHYSASHRQGQHQFQDVASTFVHEFGHSLGLHDFYSTAYQPFAPHVMVDSTSIPNCDNTPGCPKWCSGESLSTLSNPCEEYSTESTCSSHAHENSCIWLEEPDPYFGSQCVRNEDIGNTNIGAGCLEGTGCYLGCSSAGYRPTPQNNFANRFSEKIDSEGKKHTYEPVSERFISDIFNCCYPSSCGSYDESYCAEFSKTYPDYQNCNVCN